MIQGDGECDSGGDHGCSMMMMLMMVTKMMMIMAVGGGSGGANDGDDYDYADDDNDTDTDEDDDVGMVVPPLYVAVWVQPTILLPTCDIFHVPLQVW